VSGNREAVSRPTRLKQEDLADCAPQSRISDILNGKRPVSKAIAKKLASVPVCLFD